LGRGVINPLVQRKGRTRCRVLLGNKWRITVDLPCARNDDREKRPSSLEQKCILFTRKITSCATSRPASWQGLSESVSELSCVLQGPHPSRNTVCILFLTHPSRNKVCVLCAMCAYRLVQLFNSTRTRARTRALSLPLPFSLFLSFPRARALSI
jgi:hypothetical protein